MNASFCFSYNSWYEALNGQGPGFLQVFLAVFSSPAVLWHLGAVGIHRTLFRIAFETSTHNLVTYPLTYVTMSWSCSSSGVTTGFASHKTLVRTDASGPFNLNGHLLMP